MVNVKDALYDQLSTNISLYSTSCTVLKPNVVQLSLMTPFP